MEFTQGVRFDSLGLLPEMTRALEKKNIEWSTPVQAGCIPPMREWKDVIAKAPTGTGKTFAFGIPIIEHIDPESEEVQAVIMAPTRRACHADHGGAARPGRFYRAASAWCASTAARPLASRSTR